METIITANDIQKKYRKVHALQGVSLEVNKGEIFGLLGPDGAGKTSLVRILATLLLADNGAASVCGYDVVKDYRSIRKIIGYMPGHFSLYQDLTVRENLEFFASIFNTSIEENYDIIRPIYEQLQRFDKRLAANLSGGMKQKLALCCALIHNPPLLFLDEPTTGVDPVSRKEFWEMLKSLQSEYGLSILVTTPYMDEAMNCDRIAMISSGKILERGTPQELIDKYEPQITQKERDMFFIKAQNPLEDVFIHLMLRHPDPETDLNISTDADQYKPDN